MMINTLSIWDSIEIDSKDKDYTELKSRIAEYIDGGVLITTPVGPNGSPRLVPGQTVKVLSSKNGNVTEWTCTYDGVKHLGNLVMHKILCDKDGKTINRRETFRVPLIVDILIRRKSLKEDFSSTLKDISYEGVGFSSREEFEVNDVITFKVAWETHKIDVEAKIVRKCLVDKDRGFNYGAIIIESDKNLLGKLLYDLQIKAMRRKK